MGIFNTGYAGTSHKICHGNIKHAPYPSILLSDLLNQAVRDGGHESFYI